MWDITEGHFCYYMHSELFIINNLIILTAFIERIEDIEPLQL